MLHNKDIRGIPAYASMTLLPNKKWKGLLEIQSPLLKNQRNRLKLLQVMTVLTIEWHYFVSVPLGAEALDPSLVENLEDLSDEEMTLRRAGAYTSYVFIGSSNNDDYTMSNCLVGLIDIKLNLVIYP